MTAINSNRAIRGPVTAIPLVAGKGVKITADTVNNRYVAEVDETVLWEGEGTGRNFPITLSESITNFERIRVYVKWHPTVAAAYQSIEYLVSSANDVWQGMLSAILDANSFYQSFFTLTVSNGTSVAYTYGRLRSNYAVAQTNEKQATFCKVVGINRV